MNEIKLKKEELKSVLNGRGLKSLSIEEAKRKLAKTDPGIDIGMILKIINSPKKNKLKIFLIEFISNPELISYFSPVIEYILLKIFIRD